MKREMKNFNGFSVLQVILHGWNLKRFPLFHLPQIKNIKDKKFDILFICSNFKRNIKNIKFIKNLYFSPYLKNYKKALIGKDSNKYINNHDDYNILHGKHGNH